MNKLEIEHLFNIDDYIELDFENSKTKGKIISISISLLKGKNLMLKYEVSWESGEIDFRQENEIMKVNKQNKLGY